MPFKNLPETLQHALKAREYDKPTAVQAAVIENDADGRDLIVSAQTGSGKTVAFGLAMSPQILEDTGKMPFLVEPLALIIAPTRELALQVSRELSWLYADAGAQIATCVGGMDASKERRSLRKGAHIIVGTPGRLRDHLERGALDLAKLRVTVLDEADEMLDMGFRDDLEEILDATPDDRRTLLFSATMPKQIVSLAKRYQNDAMRISTVGEDRGHGDISYEVITVAPADTENAVVNLLRYHEAESAMLFCGTRDAVRRLHASLVERGFSAVALSGEHTQAERNQAMQALRNKRARVCVATDVAARGLDLPTLSLVIHVEIPRDPEALQHRSGRTGRAGRKGTAVIIAPYQRRKRVERMLRDAKVRAEWKDSPSREDIIAKDNERMMSGLLEPIEIDEEDRKMAELLLEKKTPEEIAVALVQAHRAKMPAPEKMLDKVQQSQPRDSGPRAGFEDTVWYSMNVGHNQRADARWILPVLCRRGHITKNEIGAIRINGDTTLFEVPRKVSAKFMEAVTKSHGSGNDDTDDIEISQFNGTPREAAKRRGRDGGREGGRGGGRDSDRGRSSGRDGRKYSSRPTYGNKHGRDGGRDGPRDEGKRGGRGGEDSSERGGYKGRGGGDRSTGVRNDKKRDFGDRSARDGDFKKREGGSFKKREEGSGFKKRDGANGSKKTESKSGAKPALTGKLSGSFDGDKPVVAKKMKRPHRGKRPIQRKPK